MAGITRKVKKGGKNFIEIVRGKRNQFHTLEQINSAISFWQGLLDDYNSKELIDLDPPIPEFPEEVVPEFPEEVPT